jgi:hypothetical protein
VQPRFIGRDPCRHVWKLRVFFLQRANKAKGKDYSSGKKTLKITRGI